MIKTILLSMLLCFVAMALHIYPENPDPTCKEFFGKLSRDDLVMTNVNELITAQGVTNVINHMMNTNVTLLVTNSMLTITEVNTIIWQESFGGYFLDSKNSNTVKPNDHATTFITLLAGTNTLIITAPDVNINSEGRDFILVIDTVDRTDITFNGFTKMLAADIGTTNSLKSGTTTLMYFTEFTANEWFIGRLEAFDVTP